MGSLVKGARIHPAKADSATTARSVAPQQNRHDFRHGSIENRPARLTFARLRVENDVLALLA
jgi:hypothetical protein